MPVRASFSWGRVGFPGDRRIALGVFSLQRFVLQSSAFRFFSRARQLGEVSTANRKIAIDHCGRRCTGLRRSPSGRGRRPLTVPGAPTALRDMRVRACARGGTTGVAPGLGTDATQLSTCARATLESSRESSSPAERQILSGSTNGDRTRACSTHVRRVAESRASIAARICPTAVAVCRKPLRGSASGRLPGAPGLAPVGVRGESRIQHSRFRCNSHMEVQE